MSENPELAPPKRARNPWWIPPFLGRIPSGVDAAQTRLLGTISLALLFENYDQAMLTQALKHIAADFGLEEGGLGYVLSAVRLGSIGAFLLVPFADRFGRRRMFLISVIGMGIATTLCAFTRNVTEFVALQMAARFFMITSSATAFVIVTEELPAAHRGWGIGMLGALSTFGVGLSALMFGVIDFLPYTWRAMYLVGFVPLLLLPMFRRRVTETSRFQMQRESAAVEGARSGFLRSWWQPLRELMVSHPWRTLAVSVLGAGSAGGHAVAYNFSAFFVQEVHGWAPAQYSVLLLTAGLAGVVGHPWAGRVADRVGRRGVGVVLFGVFPFLSLAFYHGPGWSLPFVWVPLVFTLTGGDTIVRALTTELFPTSRRGTAAGLLQLVDTLSAAGCLALVSLGTPEGGSSVRMIVAVSFVTLASAIIVVFLPETKQRELEEISGKAG